MIIWNIISKGCIACILISSSLYANDGFEDDEFGGDESIEIVQAKKEEQKSFNAYGSVSLSSSYNYAHDAPLNSTQNDFRGLSSVKASTDLNLEKSFDNGYKIKSILKIFKDFIYDIKDDEYKITPNDYDHDINVNELYFQGSINNKTDVKIGRQIVVWGKSDNIRITDTLNPMDYTTPGMVDIKDLRLGRTMSKIDYFIDKWSLTGIILHENRFSKMPQYGSDYAPANEMMANSITVDEPSNSLKNSGVALSFSGNLEGQDIAFYYSNQYIDNTTYKSNMLGVAYNKVMNSFLFKTEFAYFDNYDSDDVKSKTDGLIGLEYNGINDGSVSLEIANKTDDIQYALRFTQSYINQTLDFTALYSGFGSQLEDGGFIRIWTDYAYNDDISVSLGIIDYLGGDGANFEMIKDNDRVFASLKYSF